MAAAILATSSGAAVATAQVPRGRRTPRPEATHLVAQEAECKAGEIAFTLREGTQVRISGRLKGRSVQAQLLGPVSASCRVAPGALGARLSRDVPVRRGIAVVGDAYAGALVRLDLEARAGRGQVAVESVGDTRASFVVPRDALTAEPREFVYRQPPVNRWVTPKADVALFARKESVNTNAAPVAMVSGGVEVLLLEQDGALAKVRSYGPIEIEGWSTNNAFLDERAPAVEPQLLSPTHEVLASAILVDEQGAKIADLAGGALVEVTKTKGPRARITTTGRVVVSGYVDQRDLRPLADTQILPTP